MVNHTPVSEQRRLVAQWRHSGLSRTAFAAKTGIPTSTFTTWVQKHTADTALAAVEPEFIDVTPVPTSAPMSAPISVQLALRGRTDVTLTFDALAEAQWFGAMLREVSAC